MKTLRRAALIVLLLGALFWVWHRETQQPHLVEVGGPPRRLVITQGASVARVARQLHGLGFISHPLVFRALVFLHGSDLRLKAGEYCLATTLSPAQIVDLLERGEVQRRFVTFPEGKSIADMAAIVAAADLDAGEFLAAAQSSALIHDLDPQAHDLEGYLFPDTYDIPTGTQPAAALVEHMVLRFREIWTDEMRDAPHGDLTTREIVTLASLVELESARGEERPMIAAVFLNRLKKKMRLQTDPTVIYALKRGGHYDGNIRKADLAMDSPYNTYRRPGLPPGPIAAPGREALRAALHPAQSDALYFVSRNDGTHQFSRTLAEHERAVDRYQRRRRRANNG